MGARVLLPALLLLSACGSPGPEGASPEAPSAGIPSPAAPEIPGRWTFEGDAEGSPPAGFSFGLSGKGRPGAWVVRAEPGAPSGGKVLAQADADPTDARYPVALADGVAARDLRLSVRFRTVSGSVDRAAGLVFRARDPGNYLLVRVNALEGNVAFFRVLRGVRETVMVESCPVPDGAWTALAVEAAGDAVTAFLGGKRVLAAREPSFPGEGRVGVWTKADSVTLFDDLVLEHR